MNAKSNTSSIVPSGCTRPYTHADAELAALYARGMGVSGSTVSTRVTETAFQFFRWDGRCDVYTYADMKAAQWWHLLDAERVLSIEAWLYRTEPADRHVRYVARSDRKAGRRLIPGSRLSEYFIVPEQESAAWEERAALQVQYPDVGVFEAGSVEEAERLLRGEDVAGEMMQARLDDLRSKQAAVRVSLELQS